MIAALGGVRRERRLGPKVAERIQVGESPTDVAAGLGGVWLVNGEVLQKIDPGENRTVLSSPPPVGEGGLGLAVGVGHVWSTAALDQVVVRFDPESLARRTVRVPRAGPSDVAVDEGAVWAVSSTGGYVARIDPGTLRVEDVIDVGSEPSAVAAGDGAVWVANLGDDTVTRVEPKKSDPRR